MVTGAGWMVKKVLGWRCEEREHTRHHAKGIRGGERANGTPFALGPRRKTSIRRGVTMLRNRNIVASRCRKSLYRGGVVDRCRAVPETDKETKNKDKSNKADHSQMQLRRANGSKAEQGNQRKTTHSEAT